MRLIQVRNSVALTGVVAEALWIPSIIFYSTRIYCAPGNSPENEDTVMSNTDKVLENIEFIY